MQVLKRTFIILFALCLTVVFQAGAEEMSLTLAGEWAFTYDTDKTLMVLNEDGSAAYGGQELTWADTDDGLMLSDETGASLTLRYELGENTMIVYLPSYFQRISEIGGEGEILGTWTAVKEDSQSSYVFTEDGQFLEDGMFSGHYLNDTEACKVTLQYSADFADTDFYYAFTEDGYLCVFYPWEVIRK